MESLCISTEQLSSKKDSPLKQIVAEVLFSFDSHIQISSNCSDYYIDYGDHGYANYIDTNYADYTDR